MKLLNLFLIAAILFSAGIVFAQADAPDPDCSADAGWYIEMQKLGGTFGDAWNQLGIDNKNLAAIMFMHVQYKLELLLPFVPECGLEMVEDLHAFVELTVERTLFELLSSGMHLEPGEIAAVSERLDKDWTAAQAKSKVSYEAWHKQYAPEKSPAPKPTQKAEAAN